MKIHLGVDKFLRGGEAGAIAEIISGSVSRVDPSTSNPDIIQTKLPVSAHRMTKSVELPDAARFAPLYVRVRLPSGETLTREVPPSEMMQQEPTVILRGDSSPHEWLSWATFLTDYDDLHPEFSRGERLRDITPHFFSFERSRGLVEEKNFNFQPDFDTQMGLKSLIVSAPPAPDARLQPRYFVRLMHAAAPTPLAHLVVIPGPWMDHRRQPVATQVLLADEPGHDEEDYTAVRVLVEDPFVAPILGYLQSGDIATAEQAALMDGAEEFLFDKLENPLAAAAGGYTLLATRADDRMRDWPRNLAHLFPWLPDGCVIAAQQCLQTKGRRSRSSEALELFLQAAQRGVPTFTMGLRLLAEGLQLFAQSSRTGSDPRVREAAQWANELAECAQPGSIFTVLDDEESMLPKAARGVGGP